MFLFLLNVIEMTKLKGISYVKTVGYHELYLIYQRHMKAWLCLQL